MIEMPLAFKIYITGAALMLAVIAVGLSVQAHREKLGLEQSTTEFSWKDAWIITAFVGLWFLFPIPLVLGGIHKYVIGPICKRVFAGELMEKAMKGKQ